MNFEKFVSGGSNPRAHYSPESPFWWITEADFDAVIAIEKAAFQQPMTRDQLYLILGEQNPRNIARRYSAGIGLHGFLIYELIPKGGLRILRFAVSPQREGHGRCFLEYELRRRMGNKTVRCIVALEGETLSAQPFFEKCGFSETSRSWRTDMYGKTREVVILSFSRVEPGRGIFRSHDEIFNGYNRDSFNSKCAFATSRNWLSASGPEMGFMVELPTGVDEMFERAEESMSIHFVGASGFVMEEQTVVPQNNIHLPSEVGGQTAHSKTALSEFGSIQIVL